MTLLWIIGLVFYGGTITASTANRIVNGNPTTIEKYPFVIQVESLLHSSVWAYNCGASILTTRFVLSAAQCFSGWGSDAAFHRIRAGATYRQSGGVIVYVRKALIHPSYGSNGIDGDISVVQLTHTLSHSPSIKQATIVVHGTIVPDNLPVVLAGWGQIFADDPYSKPLHEMTVNTINNKLCAEKYKELLVPFEITKNMICVGILDDGEQYSCNDDYGGPVYYRGLVIGVISGGYSCLNGTWPGINTAVASYTNWIVASALHRADESGSK